MSFRSFIISVALILSLFAAYMKCGIYSVPPTVSTAKGYTAIVWRTPDEPLFNSPDAAALRKGEKVSLLTRGFALANEPAKGRIILTLPYMEWAYLVSTDKKKYYH